MKKKKHLVPNAPGYWWRRIGETWVMVLVGDKNAYCDDGLWGGPVEPPKWTPKCDKEKA